MTDYKEKIIKDYAHDYRDMQMSEAELESMLISFTIQLDKEPAPKNEG